MTDYVTEMMKTAECKTHPRGCTNDDVNEYTGYISNDCEGDCEDCTWYDPDEYYPDFTAEKQINIIKLLGKSTDLHYFGWGMSSLSESTDEGIIEVENDDFAQALAQLTTKLMNASELDKKKVREVLEDAR